MKTKLIKKTLRDPKTGKFLANKDKGAVLSAVELERSAIIEATGGDPDVAMFFLSWLKNGKNSKKAYLELHPDVTESSAGVLGCRMLNKVNVSAILESYGIGVDTYLQQLKAGIEANQNVVIGSGEDAIFESVPDHRTRRHYHKALGEMLKLEGAAPVVQVNNQNNLQQNNIESLADEDLDLLINR